MKPTLLLLCFFLLLIGRCKKKDYQSMMVIKGCEGTYLRLNDKDHLICNEVLLDKYNDRDLVEVILTRDDKCVSDRFHCAMLHAYACEVGTFKVTKIK